MSVINHQDLFDQKGILALSFFLEIYFIFIFTFLTKALKYNNEKVKN